MQAQEKQTDTMVAKKKRKRCAAMAPDAPWNSIERSRPTASAASTAKHHIRVR